jgi:hypothetical protein
MPQRPPSQQKIIATTRAKAAIWTKAHEAEVIAAWKNRLGKFVAGTKPRPQAGLPDLIYAGSGCPHADVSPAGQTKFLIPITNQGNALAGPSLVQLEILGIGSAIAGCPPLRPGQTSPPIPFTFPLVIAAPGYSYVITVNYLNLVNEENYLNNVVQNSCIG